MPAAHDLAASSSVPLFSLEPEITNFDINTCNTIDLLIYYQNVNSIRSRTRLNTVFMSALELDYDVYVLCETNLDPLINDRMVFPECFKIYRCDRTSANSAKESGGGVLIAVHTRFTSNVNHESTCNEQISVKINIDGTYIILCCAYIPPGSDYDRYASHISEINSFVNQASPETKIFVIGDFNLKNTSWMRENDQDIHYLPIQVRLPEEALFVDEMAACDLVQICGLPNQNNRFLDLLFTNDEESCQLKVCQPLINIEAHHNAMSLAINVNQLWYESCDVLPMGGPQKTSLNFRRLNEGAISRALRDIDWRNVFLQNDNLSDPIFFEQSSTEMLDFLNTFGIFDFDDRSFLYSQTALDYNVMIFYAIVYTILASHCQVKTEQADETKFPEWFDHETKRLYRNKQKLKNIAHRHDNLENNRKYKTAANAFKAKHRAQYKAYVDGIQLDIQNNPRKFWKFVNNKRKNNEIPTNVSYKGEKSNNSTEATELFAEHFKSVYANADQRNAVELPAPEVNFPHFTLTADDIRRKILSLDGTKGSGPDGLPNSLLTSCVDGFVFPLVLLFNSSLDSGLFPALWRISHVVPIHKNGSRLNVENYRGVAILSAIPKMFEALVHERMYPWIESRMSDTQHGFLKRRSTVTNLTEFASRTTQWMAEGFQVDTIYTDMSKAFDVVSIKPLLSALRKNGINGTFLHWIEAYLTNRIQYVKLQNTKSHPFRATSGVTQGSHIGPLLFIVVMNELPSFLIEVFVLIYADDVKFFIPVANTKDCLILQHNLDVFRDFCITYGLTVNAAKCSSITFTRKSNNIRFDYRIGSNLIQRKESVRDLGVEMDKGLTFVGQIDKVVAKANSLFGMTRRLCQDFDDPYTIMAIYTGLVRSVIEYASVVWQPIYEIHRKRLEQIQKRFVRFAVRNLPWRDNVASYKDICMLLSIDTLENRRTITDAVFLRDIVAGRHFSPYISSQITRYDGRTGLRRERPFHVANRAQNYARNEPVYRMLIIFNTHCRQINVNMSKFRITDELRRILRARD